MRKMLVIDCSGSMVGNPMERIITHIGRTYPAETPWVTVGMGRLYKGTVRDLDPLRTVPGGGPELQDALRFAMAPGFHPVLVTDDCDDLTPMIEMASGRGMDLVIMEMMAGNRPYGPYEGMIAGDVTFI